VCRMGQGTKCTKCLGGTLAQPGLARLVPHISLETNASGRGILGWLTKVTLSKPQRCRSEHFRGEHANKRVFLATLGQKVMPSLKGYAMHRQQASKSRDIRSRVEKSGPSSVQYCTADYGIQGKVSIIEYPLLGLLSILSGFELWHNFFYTI
jgi:hypothetical protein